MQQRKKGDMSEHRKGTRGKEFAKAAGGEDSKRSESCSLPAGKGCDKRPVVGAKEESTARESI